MLYLSIGSSGSWAKVYVDITVPELKPNYDMEKFPRGFLKHHGFISSDTITKNGIEHPWHAWEIRDQTKATESLLKISQVMKVSGNDWFKKINNREELWDYLEVYIQGRPDYEFYKSAILSSDNT